MELHPHTTRHALTVTYLIYSRTLTAAADQARTATERSVEVWKRGAKTITDQADLVAKMPTIDLTEPVTRYFEYVQRTVDLNREFAVKWAELMTSFTCVVREQAEAVIHIVKDRTEQVADLASKEAEKGEQTARELADKAEQAEREMVRKARAAEREQARLAHEKAREPKPKGRRKHQVVRDTGHAVASGRPGRARRPASSPTTPAAASSPLL